MASEAKPIIRLWHLSNLGLIVVCPSGVVYSNQTGGYATDHPEQEGIFVPLHDPEVNQCAALDEHFYYGPKWRGHCYSGIDEETAAIVDEILARSSVSRRLTVDRDKLELSEEAWIHVIIAPPGELDFDGYPNGRGVLT